MLNTSYKDKLFSLIIFQAIQHAILYNFISKLFRTLRARVKNIFILIKYKKLFLQSTSWNLFIQMMKNFSL